MSPKSLIREPGGRVMRKNICASSPILDESKQHRSLPKKAPDRNRRLLAKPLAGSASAQKSMRAPICIVKGTPTGGPKPGPKSETGWRNTPEFTALRPVRPENPKFLVLKIL